MFCKQGSVTFPADCPAFCWLFIFSAETYVSFIRKAALATLSKFCNVLRKAQIFLFVQNKTSPEIVFTYLHEKVPCVAYQT